MIFHVIGTLNTKVWPHIRSLPVNTNVACPSMTGLIFFLFHWHLIHRSYLLDDLVDTREAQWPHGQCARLWIKWSGFESSLGTLHCVLGQEDTSL